MGCASGAGGGLRCLLATSPPIGKAFTRNALNRERGAGRVIATERDPMVVPEIELMQVKAEMGLGNVVIGAVNAAFQDREEALNAVRMNIAAHIFVGGVHYRLVRRKATAEADVKP